MKGLILLVLISFPSGRERFDFENYLTLKYGEKMDSILMERIKTERKLREIVESKSFQVPEEEVDFYLSELKAEYPDEEAYREFLVENNITEEELKKELQYELALYRFIEKEIIPQINLSGNTVTVPEQRIWREIYISSPPYYSFFKKFKKWFKAWRIRIQLLFGADFIKLVEKNSESRRRLIGGLRGPSFYDPMNRVVKKVFLMEPGDVAGPIRTKWGYYIIKLEKILPEKEAPFNSLTIREKRKVFELELEKRLNEITR